MSTTQKLLRWYRKYARSLPWRAPPGAPLRSAYEVWLSEVMLQQTTVATVRPYFEGFLKRWPTIDALAAAPQEDVLAAWAGLGYYTRARKLHECAQVVAKELGGVFPQTDEALKALPGIGPYTAAAISAIAFDRPSAVVDGNIERVISRLYAIIDPLPGAKEEIRQRVAALMPKKGAGDFAQAMMDLGASLCSPKRPSCLLCPWADDCRAHAAGIAETLPKKAPKPERPIRRGAAFWITRDGASEVLLRRRPSKGLLGGMLEIPSTEWISEERKRKSLLLEAPVEAEFRQLTGNVRHTFTHFHLELNVFATDISEHSTIPGAIWTPKEEVIEAGLPTVMKKIARLALKL